MTASHAFEETQRKPAPMAAADIQLFEAIAKEDEAGIGRSLLYYGANPNAKDTTGKPAIIWALETNKPDKILGLLFVRPGTDLYARQANGADIMEVAVFQCRSIEKVQAVISLGYKLKDRDVIDIARAQKIRPEIIRALESVAPTLAIPVITP